MSTRTQVFHVTKLFFYALKPFGAEVTENRPFGKRLKIFRDYVVRVYV